MHGIDSSFELISFLLGRELRPKLACEIQNVRMVNEIGSTQETPFYAH